MRFIFISSLMLLFLICFVYSQNVNDQTIARDSVSRRGGINVKKSRNFLLDIRKRDALPLPMPQAPGAPGAPAPPKEPAKEPPKEPAKEPAKGKDPPKDPAPPKNPAPEQPKNPAPEPPKNPAPEPPKNPAPAQPKQPQPKQPQQPPQDPQPQPPQPQPPPPQPPQASPSTVIVTATATGEIVPSIVPTVRPYNADEHGSADKLKFYQGNSWIIIFMVTNFLFFALL